MAGGAREAGAALARPARADGLDQLSLLNATRLAVGDIVPYEAYKQRLIGALRAPDVALAAGFRNPSSGILTSAGVTMQSVRGLLGLASQLERLADSGLRGDVYECGTWRGGTSIFMYHILRQYDAVRGRGDDARRGFFAFDSFQGFKRSGTDKRLDDFLDDDRFAAPLPSVQRAFELFGVPLDHVRFMRGFFESTLPQFGAPPNPIAVLRMDGDLYSSTRVTLRCLYPHVAPGGWVIVDDYLWTAQGRRHARKTKLCKQAVDEFRAEHAIDEPILYKYAVPSWRRALTSGAAKHFVADQCAR